MEILALIGESLYQALAMFWATLWALILGFTLSGAVQAFVPRETMQRALGGNDAASYARASFFGMVSSSCSYAASAMAKSLFQRGANFTASMIFMFAATNLVLELGLVLWVLLGWRFALAEFVGGAIMIVLLSLLAPRVLPDGLIERARERLGGDTGAATQARTSTAESDHCCGHDPDRSSGQAATAGGRPWYARLASAGGWADAAGYALADINMLRVEMAIGFVVAGFLAVVVPDAVWGAIFITGHGVWTSLENALVGPLIALVSFVCSVGNVPLAAALWGGGISFGGVVSFIFADLLTLPLILIYRKFYGTRLALRLAALFWLIMSATGLIVEGLFALTGLTPQRAAGGEGIGGAGFAWDYTTFLNLAFLALFAALIWLVRNQTRLGGGVGYATDPICGMQVEKANAAATAVTAGQTYYFCSDGCRDRFVERRGAAG